MYSRKKVLNISENCLGDKYCFLLDEQGAFTPIGEGGTGVVYKAEQVFDRNNNVVTPRAIKFFAFKEDLVEEYGYASNDSFKTEIINITQFNHQNIIKVIDGDCYQIIIDNCPIKIPYTVTEYIDGCTLESIFEYKNSSNLKSFLSSEEQVFNIFSQIAKGVVYLHDNNFFHCDIAPKNIFLKKNSKAEWFAIVGDLGAGRTLTKGSFKETKVIGTYDYMPDDVKVLKNRNISWEKFRELQPKWDLFGIQHTITDTIDLIKNSGILLDMWHLERLRSKLKEKEYNNSKEILDDIELLHPNNKKIFKLDELSEASNQIRQIIIPLYPAFLSYRMYSVTNQFVMQRLADVPKLIEGYLVFPGANHSRYEHSLGTYELMRKAFVALLRKKSYAEFFDTRTIIIGLISAMLSSIFHFPLSYAEMELMGQEKELLPQFDKRELFESIMIYRKDGGDSDNKCLMDCISEVYNEYNISLDELKYVIFGKNIYEKRNDKLEVLYNLLNSSVGVRNVDYIMRDSYHIGINYYIDTEALFSSMSIHNEEFCLNQIGVSTAEQVIINRYWLFKRVYWCEPTRAIIALLKYAYFIVNSEAFYKKLIEIIPFGTRSDIESIMVEFAPKESRECVKGILSFIDDKSCQRYVRVLSIGRNYTIKNAGVIWRKFNEKNYSERETIREKLEDEIIKTYGIEEERLGLPILLIDMPFANINMNLGSEIKILKHDGNESYLQEVSPMIENLSKSFNDQLVLLRVFLRPDIYKKYINSSEKIVKNLERKIYDWLYDYL